MSYREKPEFVTQTTTLSSHTNHTLYVKELRPHVTSSKLKRIFGDFKGFREVRLIPDKGVAFIEFDDDSCATTALLGVDNFRFEDGSRI